MRKPKAISGEYLTVTNQGILRRYFPSGDTIQFLVVGTEWREEDDTWNYRVINGNNMFEINDDLIEDGYSKNKSAKILLDKEY